MLTNLKTTLHSVFRMCDSVNHFTILAIPTLISNTIERPKTSDSTAGKKTSPVNKLKTYVGDFKKHE